LTRTSVRNRRALAGVLAAGTVAVLVPTAALAGNGNGNGPGGHHRSVIFINGDGMSAAHREALRLLQEGYDGQTVMDSLPVSGLQQTDPRDPDEAITDSAAAATAWATGQKSYNGAISYRADGKTPLPILGEQAKQAGLSTGLVTTAQVTDASPAAFFAKVPDRGAQSEIARQYVEESRPDVILGGGEDRWYETGDAGAYPDNPPEDTTEASSAPANLVAEAEAAGYSYVSTPGQLDAAPMDKPLLGLFANEEMFQQKPEGQGDVYAPVVPLPHMTQEALDRLSQDKDGFFLFVEEEGVDEFSHQNNATRMLQAMQALDQTVALAKQYVDRHPDTLLIVTGDHDCGGLTIEGNGGSNDDKDESGPGGTAPQPNAATTAAPATGGPISGEDGPFPIKGSDLTFNLDWTTTGHTGVPTVVTAEGSHADELTGYYPNTHLYDVMHGVLVG
jgi:alkaline phosphatase